MAAVASVLSSAARILSVRLPKAATSSANSYRCWVERDLSEDLMGKLITSFGADLRYYCKRMLGKKYAAVARMGKAGERQAKGTYLRDMSLHIY